MELQVSSTTGQIASNGAWTVVNSDFYTTLSVSTTPDFNSSTTYSVPPLTAVSLDGPIYATADNPVIVNVIPQRQSYLAGSVINSNTTQLTTVDLDTFTTYLASFTQKLFTPPRGMALDSLYGTISGAVYAGSNTVPLDYTFETTSGLVVQSGSFGNISAGADFSFTYQFTSLGVKLAPDDSISVVVSSTDDFNISGGAVNFIYE